MDASPANTRKSLLESGSTDRDIWHFHIDNRYVNIEVQRLTIQKLRKEEEHNTLALQVQRKIGCIPDADGLERLLKYEGSIEKQFYKAIDQLERLQRLRAGDHVPAPVNIDVAVDTENAG